MNSSTSPQTAPSGTARRAAIGGLLGAVVEWYDFLLYGIVAGLVFQHAFFPNISPAMGTLAAFATLGVGFLFRPLGGIVFGHFGDRYGRRRMLVLTMMIMGFATCLIGVIPSFDSIGWWAPVLLVTFRSVQGFAVGGEWGGATLMAVESAPSARKTFFSSGVQVGFSAGLLCATGAVAIMSHAVGDDAFREWGWRVPFLASAVLVLLGLWVRRGVEESPEFLEAAKEERIEEIAAPAKKHRLPLLEAISANPKAFGQIIGLRLAELLTTYVVTTFALSYSTTHLNYDRDFMLNVGLLVGALGILAVPTYAVIADRIGYRPVFLVGAVLGVVSTVPFWIALQNHDRVMVVIFAVILVNGCNSMVVSVQQPLFTGMFGTRYRYSGAGVGYQIASVVGGGFTPFIAAALVTVAGGDWYLVAAYVTVGCTVSALLMWRMNPIGSTDGAGSTATARLSPRRSGMLQPE